MLVFFKLRRLLKEQVDKGRIMQLGSIEKKSEKRRKYDRFLNFYNDYEELNYIINNNNKYYNYSDYIMFIKR